MVPKEAKQAGGAAHGATASVTLGEGLTILELLLNDGHELMTAHS